MKLKKILACTVVAALAATAMVMPTSAEETYKLGIGLTSAEWVNRDTIDESGLKTSEGDLYESDVEFVDAEITGDGTYTVEAKNLPEEFNAPWNLLVIRGTLPFSKDLAVEILEVESDSIIDNSAEKEPNLEAEGLDGTLKVDLYNTWNGTAALDFNKGKSPTYLKITFKLTGLGYEAQTSADETSADETSADETSDDDNTAETTEADNNTSNANDGKQPANTGIESVAVVAGLAILATGAIVIAKKRK